MGDLRFFAVSRVSSFKNNPVGSTRHARDNASIVGKVFIPHRVLVFEFSAHVVKQRIAAKG